MVFEENKVQEQMRGWIGVGAKRQRPKLKSSGCFDDELNEGLLENLLPTDFLGMRENGKGNGRWFSVDSKSFEISMEGGGNKLKGKIT